MARAEPSDDNRFAVCPRWPEPRVLRSVTASNEKKQGDNKCPLTGCGAPTSAFVTLLALAVLPGVALAKDTPEKPALTMAVGGLPGLYYLPVLTAQQLGYFKDEGLDVTLEDFAGGSKALEAVVGGSADVGAGAFEHTLFMQARANTIGRSC